MDLVVHNLKILSDATSKKLLAPWTGRRVSNEISAAAEAALATRSLDFRLINYNRRILLLPLYIKIISEDDHPMAITAAQLNSNENQSATFEFTYLARSSQMNEYGQSSSSLHELLVIISVVLGQSEEEPSLYRLFISGSQQLEVAF